MEHSGVILPFRHHQGRAPGRYGLSNILNDQSISLVVSAKLLQHLGIRRTRLQIGQSHARKARPENSPIILQLGLLLRIDLNAHRPAEQIGDALQPISALRRSAQPVDILRVHGLQDALELRRRSMMALVDDDEPILLYEVFRPRATLLILFNQRLEGGDIDDPASFVFPSADLSNERSLPTALATGRSEQRRQLLIDV